MPLDTPSLPDPADLDAVAERLQRVLDAPADLLHVALRTSPVPARLEALRHALAARLATLLADDRPRLVQIFYALDLDEQRVERLLSEHPLADIPRALADLVLDRALAAQALAARFRVHDRDAEFVSRRR